MITMKRLSAISIQTDELLGVCAISVRDCRIFADLLYCLALWHTTLSIYQIMMTDFHTMSSVY